MLAFLDPHYTRFASDELTRRTLNQFNKEPFIKQTQKMILLTWLVLIFTTVMFLGLLIQIILAIYR